MQLNLAKESGLNDSDFLFHLLKVSDECLKSIDSFDEFNLELHQDLLSASIWKYLGFPEIEGFVENGVIDLNQSDFEQNIIRAKIRTKLKIVEIQKIYEYQDWLIENNEPIIANFIDKLLKNGMDAVNIRAVLMFIFPNIENFKQKECGYRSVFSVFNID